MIQDSQGRGIHGVIIEEGVLEFGSDWIKCFVTQWWIIGDESFGSASRQRAI